MNQKLFNLSAALSIDALLDATFALGSTTKNFKSLNLDNGATDGGSVFFDAGTTSFLKSAADGLTLDIGGFTSITTVANAIDHGNLGGRGDDDHTQYVLANATRALTADWDIGDFALTAKSLTLNNGATDGGAVYFDDTSTSFLKSAADGLTLDIGGFTLVEPSANDTTSLGVTAKRFKHLFTSGGHHVNTTTVAAASYDLLVTDHVLLVTYTGTGTCAIDLKTAQVVAGRILKIKDAGGNASVYNITITTEGAQTIDGAATFVMNSNYQSVELVCDGTNWFVL